MDEKTATVWIQLIQNIGSVLRWLVIAGFAFMGMRELAGKETEALITASLEYTSGPNGALIFLAAASMFYGLWERRFRIKKIQYLTKRIRKLETAADPERSSSGLPSTGNTHPEDK